MILPIVNNSSIYQKCSNFRNMESWRLALSIVTNIYNYFIYHLSQSCKLDHLNIPMISEHLEDTLDRIKMTSLDNLDKKINFLMQRVSIWHSNISD